MALAGCDGGPTGPQPATIELSAPSLEVETGEELQLTAEVRDASGNPVSVTELEWSSSNPQRASVSDQGLVAGIEPGNVSITARTGSVSGSLNLEVVGPAPTVTAISPAVLRQGEDAFLDGEGFSSTPAQNRVRIGGRLATVLEASETSLVVRVPTGVCYPGGEVPVTASLGGSQSTPLLHPFEGPEATPMAVGEFRRITLSEAHCLRLGASGSSERYIVGAQSTTGSASSIIRFTLEGRRAAAAAGESTAHATHPPMTPESTRAGALPATGRAPTAGEILVDDRFRRHRTFKTDLRQAEARSMAPVLAEGIQAARAREAQAAHVAAIPGNVQEGDTVSLSIPDISVSDFCQNGRPLQAVVRSVGSGSIWVEDLENPDGFSDAQYANLSNLFDYEILDEVTDYFGEPTDLDDNDRIVVVITEKVNRMNEFALGFVVTVDFFPNQCPAGNGGEYYYARSPDPQGVIPGPDGSTGNPYSVQDAIEDAPVLLAHETTHIIQFGRRLQLPGIEQLPTIWELEGQATLAEEVAGFRVRGLQPRQNHPFNIAFLPESSTEDDWFQARFVDLAVYYGFRSRNSPRTAQAPHECGWLATDADGPCDYNRLPYGVAWSFLRWISDHLGPDFPGGEQAIQRQMIDNLNAGFDTLEDVLDQPIAPLLAWWAASLYTDGRVSSEADPRLTFPTWDLRSIDQGLVSPARLQPISRSFLTFSDERRVAAGASAYYLIEGGARPDFTLQLRPVTGDALPSFIQMWAVRLQ